MIIWPIFIAVSSELGFLLGFLVNSVNKLCQKGNSVNEIIFRFKVTNFKLL